MYSASMNEKLESVDDKRVILNKLTRVSEDIENPLREIAALALRVRLEFPVQEVEIPTFSELVQETCEAVFAATFLDVTTLEQVSYKLDELKRNLDQLVHFSRDLPLRRSEKAVLTAIEKYRSVMHNYVASDFRPRRVIGGDGKPKLTRSSSTTDLNCKKNPPNHTRHPHSSILRKIPWMLNIPGKDDSGQLPLGRHPNNSSPVLPSATRAQVAIHNFFLKPTYATHSTNLTHCGNTSTNQAFDSYNSSFCPNQDSMADWDKRIGEMV